MAAPLKLYHYWRSTSSWRVRWALAHKGLLASTELVAINLLDDSTDRPEFRALNPLGYVPVLEAEGARFTESVAILEWLDETRPEPRLYPGSPVERAHIRALVEVINAGTQPLQNLSALLAHSEDPEARKRWAQHWIRKGLHAFEVLTRSSRGVFSVGDTVTAADLLLIPQCYAAGRQEVSIAQEFPALQRICDAALATPAAQSAHPDRFDPEKVASRG